MKAWFTFLVDGEKIAFFAHSDTHAMEILRRTHPYAASVEYLGECFLGHNLPDTFSYEGLTLVDCIVASESLNLMETLAKGGFK